ncbi:hypothetical protein I5M27_09635 [Adhaeribacter sp. BT258]|uniref:Uncharacterized protein n=1 Tax=Adhaeribacter terrigena TaxID=2793070 RepID=A0ABS1C1G5_9BACT|nr:hypothetical protein [Adhaeribacter terrigena]MBK0403246.1 hypothetical protein [Adhaeribacter terrigena]
MKYYIISYSGGTPGESGESCGTEYSFVNACEVCGTGAEPLNNLKVKGVAKTKKEFFETLDGDWLISKNLYNRIRKDIIDFNLSQVVDKKNKPLDFYHFYSAFTLPKANECSTGFTLERQCSACLRNGYFNDAIIGNLELRVPTTIIPLDLHYDTKDFTNLPNSAIYKTWECTGLSNKANVGNRVIRYARPWIVVNDDLKSILNIFKVKNIHYEEITIKDCVQQHL